MIPKHLNLATYDDFERLDTFSGNMESYRKSKLQSAQGHVTFIKKLFGKRKITVLELGSGNSKTLFALEKAGVLKKGYGLEISKSRHEFAELWKREGGFGMSENRMILRLYKKADLQKLLQEAGFAKVAFYANWKGGKFQNDKGEYIAVGAK